MVKHIKRTNNLKTLMFLKGVTQSQLARELGVCRMSVWHWCHNTYTFEEKHEQAIAQRLGVTVDELYTERTPTITINTNTHAKTHE